jgi:hypothetical protein
MGIVTTASSPFSTRLLFRTGGQNTFFIFDARPSYVGLRYPQHQIERMVWIIQFVASWAFFTLNEALPPLE